MGNNEYVLIFQDPENFVSNPRVFRNAESAKKAMREDAVNFFIDNNIYAIKDFEDLQKIDDENLYISDDYIEFDDITSPYSRITYLWRVFETVQED